MRLRPLDIGSRLTLDLDAIELTLDEILDDLLYPARRGERLTGREDAR